MRNELEVVTHVVEHNHRAAEEEHGLGDAARAARACVEARVSANVEAHPSGSLSEMCTVGSKYLTQS